MRFDLLLKGGRVVNHDGVVEADVGIEAGLVAALVRPGVTVDAAETVDVMGKLLFPGAIDPHAHVTDDRPFDASIERETPTMALGGTTTLIDFLATEDSYHELAPQAMEAIDQRSYIDVGLHCVVQTALHIEELEDYVTRYGMTSFKMFMAASGRRLYPTMVGIPDGLVFRTLRRTAELGPNVCAMIHAENWEIVWSLKEELEAAGRVDPAAWTESRPNICEVDCLNRIALLTKEAGCRMYAVHLSTHEAPALLREYRGQGVAIFGETCPHYLMIHKDHELAGLAKYNPAIKWAEDCEALWEAVGDGTIDCIGSDHIPVRLPDKLPNRENIWQAQGGVPGAGTILPLLVSEGMMARGIAPERVAAVTSYNAARIFGLLPRKGHIAVGADADIVLVDPERRVTVTPELLGLDFTLFDGREFRGWPEAVMLRGQFIVKDGELQVGPGAGRYLMRSPG